MTQHNSDTLAISFSQDLSVFIHRKDQENKQITLQTMELKRFEVNVLLGSLLDNPEFQEEAITYLDSIGKVRRNHPIP